MTTKDQHLSLDRISALPQPIIETILCFLPTRQAARTSILSRDWRYQWTKISKLDFDLCDLARDISEEKEAQGINTEEYNDPEIFHELLQILLLHQGPIQDFTLDLGSFYDFFGLDQILLHLSKNHRVKKLALYEDGYGYSEEFSPLPMSAFLLPHLTHLSLRHFIIEGEHTFNRFQSLTSIDFVYTDCTIKTLLQLLSSCPSLKELSLANHWSTMKSVPHKFPVLFNLEYICFKDISFEDGHGLPFILLLIKCAPNLKKIELKLNWSGYCDYERHPVTWEKYSDIWFEHLNVLKIKYYKNTKLEMKFLRFILAKSPKLNTIFIISKLLRNEVDQEPEAEMLEFLSQVPRSLSHIIKYKRSISGSVYRDL